MIKSKTIFPLLLSALALPAAAQSEGVLYGFNADMMNTQKIGLYQLPFSGSAKLMWADPLTYPNGESGGSTPVRMLSSWMRNGTLCGIASNYPVFGPDFYKYVEHDLQTGEVLSEYNISLSVNPTDMTNFLLCATYNPYDEHVYGFGVNAARNGYAFKSAPAGNLNDVKIVREVATDKSKMCGAVAVHPLTGTLYGFTWTNDFVRIDPLTGESTLIFHPNIPAKEMRQLDAMTYWAETGEFLLSYSDDTAVQGLQTTLYSINPDKKTFKVVNNFGSDVVCSTMVTVGSGNFTPESAPAAANDLRVAFPGEGMPAEISFSLPLTSFGGGALSGTLDWNLTDNGNPVKQGSGTPGENISLSHDFVMGTHILCLTVSQEGVAGMPAVKTVSAGGEIPSSPTAVRLEKGILSWEPVTLSVSGAAVEGVEYRVSLNSEYVATTTATTYDLNSLMRPDYPLTPYRATVEAVIGTNSSNPVGSNKEIVGQPMPLPVELEADEWDFDLCTTVDADGNGTNWSLYNSFYLSGYGQEATDDWLFLPKTSATGTSSVSLSFIGAAPETNMTGGTVEAWVCSEPKPEAALAPIFAAQPVNGGNPVEYKGDAILPAQVTEAGQMYVGVRVRSQGGHNCPALLQDIALKASNVSAHGPKPVDGLRAEAAPLGALEATVYFTPSAMRNDGTPIEAGVKTMARVATTSATYEVECQPGVEASVLVDTESGYTPVTVTPFADGEQGLSATCTVFTGPDVPGYLRNVRTSCSSDNSTVNIKWDYPTEGWNGGYPSTPNTQAVAIYVRGLDEEGEMTYQFVSQTEAGQTEASLASGVGGKLQNMEIGLSAVNMMGECPSLNTLIVQTGTPYTLPMNGDFEEDYLLHEPFNVYSDKEYGGQTEFKWTRPTKFGDYEGDHEWAFITRALKDEARSRMDFPKFATTGMDKVGVHLTLWSGTDAATTTVTAKAYPSFDPQVIGVAKSVAGSSYTTFNFNLPAEAANQPWVLLSLLAEYANADDVMILADYAIDDNATSVEGISVQGSVAAIPGGLRISGYDGQTATAHSLDGRLVAKAICNGEVEMRLDPGVYVLAIGKLRLKTIVK